MKKYLLLGLISASFVISGCTYTEYQHIEPQSRGGKMCVADCEYEHQVCLSQKQRAEQGNKRQYEKDVYYYQKCTQRQYREKDWSVTCPKPTQVSLQGYDCKRIYDTCFTACGGQIRAVERQM